jgi:L-ribulose-5-phosphate 4-epimerase
MTITDNTLTAGESAFVEQVTATVERAFRVLRETGTISASGTVQVNERLPGPRPSAGATNTDPACSRSSGP